MSMPHARRLLLLLELVALSSCASTRAPGTADTSLAPAASRRETLTHLGVAGWKLESSGGTLLFDPYVTRAAVEDESAPLVPNETAIAAYTPSRADVVLVGHSHYDHVLDVPSIARRTGATVIGTESTARVAAAGGIPADRIRVVHGGESFTIGPFAVRVVASRHSLTGQDNVPIPAGVTLPMAASAYVEGGTLQYLVRFEGRSIYFVGTANFIEEDVRALDARPDVAIVAVGLREKIPNYTCRLLDALGRPPLVMPNHFDAFREPLRPGEMALDPSTRANLDAFIAEVGACAPGTRVEVPVPLQATKL